MKLLVKRLYCKGLDYIKAGSLLDAFCVFVMAMFFTLGWDFIKDTGSESLAGYSMLSKVITLVMALVFIRITLRAFDLLSGINMKSVMENLTPKEQVPYLAARFVGVCLLAGFILG